MTNKTILSKQFDKKKKTTTVPNGFYCVFNNFKRIRHRLSFSALFKKKKPPSPTDKESWKERRKLSLQKKGGPHLKLW